MRDRLERAVHRVVVNDNCSGCGGCTLVSDRIGMELSTEGWMRPVVSSGDVSLARVDAARFRSICPGVRLDAPVAESPDRHPTFGRYISAWRGRAADPEVRRAGSSAGVLSALAIYLVDSGQVPAVQGAAMSPVKPTRTVPVRITTRDEALTASGSRYAPVATLSGAETPTGAVVAKPCEIAALRRTTRDVGYHEPIMLSFFCAGTPSQRATDELVQELGIAPDEVSSLRYRGDGWPGQFTVTDGTRAAGMSYDDSWGNHLGRDLQWRCKICPDGTGEDSDIAVGDFWKSDARGYPLFDDAAGESVVIARNVRGHQLLMAAAEAGAIILAPVDLDEVDRIQPLQRSRKRTLAARLIARRLTFKRVPRFSGYGMTLLAAKHPRLSAKTFVGTLVRSWRDRVKGRRT